MPNHDFYKPSVCGALDDKLQVIICKNPITQEVESIRFDPKYTRQVALDLLDMADELEKPRDGKA